MSGFTFEMPDPAPSAFPPVDVEISRLFVPEEIITQNIRGEFRQIVNLFMRFPDLPDQKLQECVRVVFELCENYGGLVTRLDFGDKGCNMLMLWGAPVAYENDIGRALNFILDLKARVDFPITAGITYYVAHAGYLGSSMCEDYTCYGWGVNLASRFMMSAAEGEVWVDERIARRVKNRFDFEAQSAQYFKGFSAEQKVFSISGRKSQELFHPGEFVGRELELPRLIDCIQPLWDQKFAGLTVVWGDAGIGKSRLIYELKATHVDERKHILWALCHTDQILRQSFNPFRYWLFRYFGIDSSMVDELQKQIFNTKLDDLIESVSSSDVASELDWVRSVLGALIDLYWNDSLYEQLDAEGRYNITLTAIMTLIKAESLRQPLVLFVEDAQFLDDDSKAFLPRLKRALTVGNVEYPVAILISSRHVGMETLLAEELIDHAIDLGPLTTQALFNLAEIYLGGAASPDLLRLLEIRSEGNPYFAEQILMYLQEEKLLEMSAKGWNVIRRLQEASLPADIRALLVARLDQLTRRVREVIQTAAVLGREFEVHVLAEMLQDENLLSDEITAAEKAEIWTAISQIRYLFTHGLLRDAAYSMQMRAHRMELHAIAVTALEKVYVDELDHHYGELAYHSERARLIEKALFYLRCAGKAASDAYQNSLAVDYFTRALVFVASEDLETQFDTLAERVELYSRMGKRDLQLKDLDFLKFWAEQLNDADRTAKQLMWRSTYFYFLGNYQTAIEQGELAQEKSSVLAQTGPGLYSQVVICMSLLYLGRTDEAMRRAFIALELSQSTGNRKEEGRILTAMGLIALESKDPVDAQKYLIEAVEIARQIKDLSLEARALNNLAKAEGSVSGNYSRAREYYEEVYKLTREIGDRHAESTALSSLGFVAGMLGDFAAARLYHEQSAQIAREIDSPFLEMYTLINLSALAGVNYEVESALQFAQQAANLAHRISQRSGEAWAMLYMGHAYLLRGELESARKAYQKSVEIRIELNQISLSMEPIAGFVETHLQENNLEAASAEAEKIIDYMASGATLDGTEEPLRIYYACYRFLEKKKDPRARQLLVIAKNLLAAQASKFSDDNARKRYIENIPWRRAIWEETQT
ncbi:MAG: tetratricopeptide repeat protein [Chloroflexota bacterium]